MKKKYLFILSLLFIENYFSQNINFNQKLAVNKRFVYKSDRLDSVVNFLSKYHEKMFDDLYYFGEFWDEKTKKENVFPDYMLKQEFADYELDKIKPNIINVYRASKEFSTAQVGYSYFDTLSKSTNVFCVYTFAIKKTNDSLKLFPLIETYNLKTYNRKDFTFYSKNFNEDHNNIVDSLEHYNKKVSLIFKIEPIQFRCYKFDNFVDLNTSIGLDVQKNYSREVHNAYADMYNKIIYSTDVKTFFHELVHIYVGNKYIKSCHNMINEGLATYLGGTANYQLNEHLKIIAKDIKNKPNLDLSIFSELEYEWSDNLDSNYKFNIGGLICKLIYEKHGFKGLELLMTSGFSDMELSTRICYILNLKKENLNTFLRKELSNYL